MALTAIARILAPWKNEISAADVGATLERVGIASADAEEAPLPDDAADDEQPPLDEDGNPVASSDDSEAAAVEGEGEGDVERQEAAQAAAGLSMSPPAGVNPSHHAKAMSAAKEAYIDALYKMTDDDPTNDPEDEAMPVKKNQEGEGTDLSAFTPEQQAQMAAIFKSQSDAHEAQVAELKEQLAAAKAEAVQKSYVAKARNFPRLGAKAEDLVKVFAAVGENSEAASALDGILKSAHEQLAYGDDHGIFTELGSAAMGESDAADRAEDAIAAMVDGKVAKSDGDKGPSPSKAYREVLKSAEGRKVMAKHDRQHMRRLGVTA